MMRHSHGLLRSRRSRAGTLQNDTPSEYTKGEEVRLKPDIAKNLDEPERCKSQGANNEAPSKAESIKSFISRPDFDSRPLIVDFPGSIVADEESRVSQWHRSTGRRSHSLKSELSQVCPPMGESLVGHSQMLFSDDEEGMSIETIGSLNGLSEADIDDIFD